MTAFALDRTVRRFGTTVLGGSPLRLFRLTTRGAEVVDRIARGDDVARSRLTDALVDAGAIHPVARTAPSQHGEADVTVVVPTLGPPAHRHAGHQVLLVDDGSTPPVPGAAIRLERNAGPGTARNAGLAIVATPLVAFVDGDVRLPAGWLAALLPHFDDERVALVAPRVRSRAIEHRSWRTPDAWERDHSPLDLGPDAARIRAGSRVSYVPAAAIVCRTAALREVGGFDEGLRLGEDVDLVWRLDAAGWRCRYEPAVEVEHDPRPNWAAWIRQRVGYGSSAGPLALRHPGALAPFRASGWSVAVWALAVLGRPGLGIVVGAGTSAALVRKLPDVPAAQAARLAALGNLRAGEQLATAVRRAWWPILALTAIRARWARRTLVAATVAAGHPLRVADDVAYSLGVWRGVARARTLGPLAPELTSWPGRRTPPATPADPLPSTG